MSLNHVILLFSLFSLVSCSCSKEEEKLYGPTEMWFVALDVDPTIELVPIPNHETNRRVVCKQYPGTGCVAGSGKRIKVRKVELLVIQFNTVREACESAKAIGQWYARNWVLDDVTNEPVLQGFVKKAFDAKDASLVKDCSLK